MSSDGRPAGARRRRPDDGVATVWAAVAVAVLTSVLVACLHLGAAILARHRAESAADLAALAAARQAVRGEAVACRAAATIAAAAGGALTRCLLVGWNAVVEVRVPVAMAAAGLDSAVGRAMAGPALTAPTPRNGRSTSGSWPQVGGPLPARSRRRRVRGTSSAIHRSRGALIVAAAPIGDAVWPCGPSGGLLEQVLIRFRPDREPRDVAPQTAVGPCVTRRPPPNRSHRDPAAAVPLVPPIGRAGGGLLAAPVR